ncbi:MULTISPECIES: RpiB/LacA/LacB family sugar-phosphate isomerase [unclassified Campylobacter]|uniref:RpiB/LacA/LacB family sugar-phosphate isomerase n=1 Tax=unclassified Campylobacter TaxID=2593542 RepID=UPI001BD9F3C1|nr:RpiB/LacA/LacB family sugar-phosphate isomerase [Campylobacter sp. RM12651]MBT0878322.1 RpiB/LacA/LacB family sugar-phosphate isomerase [Campylobacter sp. 2018MI01]
MLRKNMRIYFANDHAATKLKFSLIEYFSKEYECINLGCDSDDSVDYPDYANKLANELKNDTNAIGVIICGSGIGISIAANRHKHIRAALCHCEDYARLAREHNDANVISLGARFVDFELAKKLIITFINTPFLGGRHENRVKKLGQ